MPDTDPDARPAAPTLRGRPAGVVAMRETMRRTEAFFSDPLAVHWGPLAPDAREPYFSALAEIAVAEALGRLPSSWVVLHALPLASGGDIDHLVIGPAGVVVVHTAPAIGRLVVTAHEIRVEGEVSDAVLRAERATRQVRRLLASRFAFDVHVQTVVAFAGGPRIRFSEAPLWGSVCSASTLAPALRARPAVLRPRQVAAIVRAAERPDTWGGTAAQLEESDPSVAFGRLRLAIAAQEPVADWPITRRTPVGSHGGAVRRLLGRLDRRLVAPRRRRDVTR